MNTTLQINRERSKGSKFNGKRLRKFAAGLMMAASLAGGATFASPAEAKDPRDPAIARPRLAETDIYDTALGFTCWIKVPQASGTATSMGTGWVVDKERRLVLTNHHVIDGGTGNKDDVMVWFPVHKDGELINDSVQYEQRITPVRGTVIDSDSTKDLALIQLNDMPEGVVEPIIADKSPRPGEHIHTVAGLAEGSQALWVYTTGVVKQVYKKRSTLSDHQTVFARVVEAQADVNKGNSGGPVLNDRGEVVAVISSGSATANAVQSFIDQEEVRDYLEIVSPLVDPQTAADFNLRGARQSSEGRYDHAIDDFNAALRMDADLAEAYANRGWAQLRRGELQIAVGDFTDAIQRDPTLTDAYQGRGMAHRRLDEVPASLADLSEAIRRDSGSDTLYNLYNERGITHYWNEDYREALADFERAVELAERDGGNFGNLTELVRAIEVERDKAQLHVNCGDALLGMDRAQDALAKYETALNLDGNRWDVAFKVGTAHEALGNADRALQIYKAVLENDKSDPEFFRVAGRLLRKQDQMQNAVEIFALGADTFTANADLCNELGVTLYEDGRYENAVKAYSLAIDRNNQNGVYFRNRGHAESQLGEFDAAIADLNQAIALDQTDAEFFFLRGKIRELSRDAEGAQPDYAQAEKMDPATYKRQYRRYLQLANNTEQKITVLLKYETMTTTGEWHWFAGDDDKGLVYELEPGQKVNLYHEDFRINARRMEIGAVGEDGTKWNMHTVSLVSMSGYITTADEPEAWDSYMYSINP